MDNDEEDELDRMMREINEQAAADLKSAEKDAICNGMKRKRGSNYREHKVQQSKQVSAKQRRKEQEELQVESLKAGIEKPIGVENKGFKLLSKFGYTGMGGLGPTGHGREEAIKIDPLSNGRGEKIGLGVKEEFQRKEKLTTEQRLRAERDFLSNTSAKFSQKAVEKDIYRAQRVIQLLDEKADIARNELWPKEKHLVQESSDSTNGLNTEHGDIWSMEQREEGNNSQWQVKEEVLEEEGEEQGQEESMEEVLNVDNLVVCLEYLRNKHFYCLYCGCAYDDHEDLAKICPGMMAEEH